MSALTSVPLGEKPVLFSEKPTHTLEASLEPGQDLSRAKALSVCFAWRAGGMGLWGGRDQMLSGKNVLNP